MHNYHSSIMRFFAAALMMLGAGSCHALSFGELEVQSRINQPLTAVIPVDGSAEELNALIVGLASLEDFDRLNMIRSREAKALQFEVILTPGLSHIRITSEENVREPIIDFVLNASWGQGKIIREYSVFISP